MKLVVAWDSKNLYIPTLEHFNFSCSSSFLIVGGLWPWAYK